MTDTDCFSGTGSTGLGTPNMEPKKPGGRSFFFEFDDLLSVLSSAIGGMDKENDERRALLGVVWLRFKELPDADAARVSLTKALLIYLPSIWPSYDL